MRAIIQNFKKYSGPALLLIIFFIGSIEPALAQSDYQRLAWQKKQPRIHITVFTLPGDRDNELKLTTTFQISNNFLSFKKVNDSQSNKAFFSPAGLSLEVFKSPEKIIKMTDKARWRTEEVDVNGLKSVARDTWQDTAYTATYEQTKLDTSGLNGSMQVDIAPGYYTYLMQLNEDDKPNTSNARNGRGNNRIRNSQTRNIRLYAYEKQQHDNLILVKNVENPENPSRLDLINMGNNVTYGQDFYAFIHLPDFKSDAKYSLQVNRIEPHEKDTTRIGTVFEQTLSPDQMVHNVRPRLQPSAKKVSLSLDKKSNGYNYALVKIPNSQFPNAVYRLTVKQKGATEPVTRDIFRSYWSDIPVSLLNLDVAIDMLHYITDDKTMKRIDDGSDQEREQKFRDFWKKKDPTPDTEFNELEAEYYHRIDQAYEKFGSQETPGFNTDRGRVYINFGKPQNVNRTYPPDGATTEVWTYPSHTFVFKATSGFGDFKLVSQK